jgi:hypothetical protein
MVMEHKSLDYIEQYNDKLGDYCDWMIQLGAECESEIEGYFRVYHIETYPGVGREPKFIGYFPTSMPPKMLAHFASVCQEYYELGKMSTFNLTKPVEWQRL